MYHSELRHAVRNLRSISRSLRRSVNAGMRGFSVVYQPQADPSGAVIGAEALLRWDPQCGHAVGPNVFVPSLERSRLIVEVGRWVLTQALDQLVAFRADGIALRHISVNVSARQLHPDFVRFVKAETKKRGLDPKDVVLELTEGQAVTDTGRHSETLLALRKAGFAIEIDDFGCGYASMRWLRKLQFSGIKLDRSLLTATDEPPGMIIGICAMARAIDLRVTAEGVETKKQRERLVAAGVDCLQGWLIGKPVPPSQFRA